MNENWDKWQLVLSGKFDFQTVFGKPYMTPQDATEANIALEKFANMIKKK